MAARGPARRCAARGWAVWKALACLLIADDDGPGGKPTWAPPAHAALRRLVATAR